MDRFSITDRQWGLMEPLCLGKVGDPGRSGANSRLASSEVIRKPKPLGTPLETISKAVGMALIFFAWEQTESSGGNQNDRANHRHLHPAQQDAAI